MKPLKLFVGDKALIKVTSADFTREEYKETIVEKITNTGNFRVKYQELVFSKYGDRSRFCQKNIHQNILTLHEYDEKTWRNQQLKESMRVQRTLLLEKMKSIETLTDEQVIEILNILER
jgi:hypothetical protein